MDIFNLFSGLFGGDADASSLARQSTAPAPTATFDTAAIPPPTPRPFSPTGGEQPLPQRQPAGNVLAHLPSAQKRSPGSRFSAGMGAGMASLSATPDPWLAFAQGFGGAVKGLDAAESADKKSAFETLKELFKARKEAAAEARAEKKDATDADIRREGNQIARERVAAYERVGSGREQSGVDADYKRSTIRKNLQGEIDGEYSRLGLKQDDEETIPSRKMKPEVRAQREAEFEKRRKDLEAQMPRIGAQPAGKAKLSEDEEDAPAPAQAPQRAAPAAKPAASIPQGMTKEQVIEQGRAAIAAGRDRDAVLQRIQQMGIPTDGL